MSELVLERKVIMSNRSLMVNIPFEIAQAMEIEKGDTIKITYKGGALICRKAMQN